MARRLTRREMIKQSATAAAAIAAAAVALDSRTSAAAAGATGSARTARVIRHLRGLAEVQILASGTGAVIGNTTVRASGFPAGWRLREGDLVVVTGPDFPGEPSTATLRLKSLVGRLEASGTGGPSESVRIDGIDVMVRSETGRKGSARDAMYEAFCIENDLDQSLSAVSIRPAPPL